jgi:anti-anti-sigma regulatory factor
MHSKTIACYEDLIDYKNSQEYTMQATLNQSGNKSVIMLEGDLTLPHAKALKEIFTKALQESDDVSIAIVTAQNVDLSCLQLLCSAHRSAILLNKELTFIGSPPPAFNDAVEAAGLASAVGCKLGNGTSSLDDREGGPP